MVSFLSKSRSLCKWKNPNLFSVLKCWMSEVPAVKLGRDHFLFILLGFNNEKKFWDIYKFSS